MINASNIFVKYGDRVLLDNVNLSVTNGEKVGLVGRNGAGKSTILKILATYQNPDKGDVVRPKESTLGFLHQEMSLPKGKTVIEETLSALDRVKTIEKRIEELNVAISERTDYESEAYADILNEFSALNEQFALLGGQTAAADAEKILKGLGFTQKDVHRLTDEFSGGWQMRVELAKMLLARPDFLLLDEPTNHLDIESIIWLEEFLKTYSGAIIVISHDKEFLNKVTKRTVEVELGKLYDYKAAYTKAMDLRKERRELQMSAFKNQQKVIAQKERTINRFMAKATKTKMAQSMKKQLDKVERISIESEDVATMNIRFPNAPRSGVVVVNGEKISKSYGALNVLNQVNLKIDRGDRIAFVGQNGQGKTTLAKILVNELSASSGDLELGHNVQLGYYAQNQSDRLYANQTLLETMEQHSPPEMRTKLRGILGAFMFSGEDVDKKVSVLSGGEKARLALACLLLKPFNLLVLDEPTNHLDMLSKEVLKQALLEYDGTLVVVSHDRDFLRDLTNRTLEFRDKKLHNYLGDVNYFLDKRKAESMREVEMRSAATSKQAGKKKLTEAERQERKKWQRAVQYAERNIEKLEAKIEKIEVQMADPNFYSSPDAEKTLATYKSAQKDLDAAMEEWETAQERLDSFEA
ncbi:MAG: ABC-F family ATP-binding cassette domain-containing protein [Bacteroidota bacterium]